MELPPCLFKRLLGDGECCKKTLESMSDVACCPRCGTPCIKDEDQHAQFPKCYFSFCTLCNERCRVGVQCMTPEMELKILEEHQNSTHFKDVQKKRERDKTNGLLSVKEIPHDSKQCPSCKIAVSRTEGCNKMVCSNCEQSFCYRCNKVINGYDHFRDGTRDLFSQPQEMIWNRVERIHPGQLLGKIQAGLFAENGQPCLNCGQLNRRECVCYMSKGNNHLNHGCWVYCEGQFANSFDERKDDNSQQSSSIQEDLLCLLTTP